MKDVREYLAEPEGVDYSEKRSVQRLDVFNTSASIQLGIQESETAFELKGIVVNLSSRGCCVIFRSESIPENYSFVRVSIGAQTNIPAQIRWMEQVDRGVFKMGLCYQL